MLPKGGRIFLTLLMSTGLTFGTISTMFGYQAGYIDKAQFSVLIAVVILSAVVPTIIAQRYFTPAPDDVKDEILAEGEEG
jgi:Kef-type K+ transport system membrane component KefB